MCGSFFEKNPEAKKAKCGLCSKKLTFHGRIMNLRDHLQKVHPLCYKKNETSAKAKQGALTCCLRLQQCSEACSQEITGHSAKVPTKASKLFTMKVQRSNFNLYLQEVLLYFLIVGWSWLRLCKLLLCWTFVLALCTHLSLY